MNDAVSAGQKDSPKTSDKALLRLLRFLGRGEATVAARDDGNLDIGASGGGTHVASADVCRKAVALGLVVRAASRLSATPAAGALLRRAAAEREEGFLAQHADMANASVEIDGARQSVRINRAESPLGPLSRLKDRDGSPFLPAEALSAGEHLASDFHRAQLQPRVTASWEPRLSSTARGGRGGMAELTDSAVAARLAVNRAIEAMGPELSGVALDVCCFMKGLEIVERERQWPARSAKLMLRTALMALSRHYAPPPARRPPPMRHWGEDGFRPELGQ
jgi:hypothetical protein